MKLVQVAVVAHELVVKCMKTRHVLLQLTQVFVPRRGVTMFDRRVLVFEATMLGHETVALLIQDTVYLHTATSI